MRLQHSLDRFDSGQLPNDPWTLLHLSMAVTVYGWHLYPLVDLYIGRAELPTDQRPPREIRLPPRWSEKLAELRDEHGFSRQT